MKQYTSILVENRGNLRIIKFNNPQRKNAWDPLAYDEISDGLKDAENDETVAIVALTGAGDFYSSGNDIKKAAMNRNLSHNIEAYTNKRARRLHKLVSAFYLFKKPLVAVINGPCIGIAATTAALCDVLYASESAYFYTPFTLFISPEGCSTYTFPKIFGPSRANEMLMFNYKLSAREAYQYKFVAELYDSDESETKIWEKLETFSKLPSNSLRATKMLTRKFHLGQLEKANSTEIAVLKHTWNSKESSDALMAFVNRKKSNL